MNEKIKWLREKLSTLDLDGMIVSNPVNIKYLTGIDAEGVLLITRKENIYITDARYTEHINSILNIDDEISLYDYKDIAPNKNDIIDIAKILEEPKKRPNAAINFTSPIPMASFPETSRPSNVNIPKITVPTSIPNNISIAKLISDIP